jgi:hypothetical protein
MAVVVAVLLALRCSGFAGFVVVVTRVGVTIVLMDNLVVVVYSLPWMIVVLVVSRWCLCCCCCCC